MCFSSGFSPRSRPSYKFEHGLPYVDLNVTVTVTTRTTTFPDKTIIWSEMGDSLDTTNSGRSLQDLLVPQNQSFIDDSCDSINRLSDDGGVEGNARLDELYAKDSTLWISPAQQ